MAFQAFPSSIGTATYYKNEIFLIYLRSVEITFYDSKITGRKNSICEYSIKTLHMSKDFFPTDSSTERKNIFHISL